ncbi:hypothetical protein SVA_2031 [Sulfurifustis variabilis]|uniref:Peptidoglycan-binding protein CsiV n=1 Tax=Sulfurifustis variabilis TaxID=1675686 RepID=A0A1B4V4W9_9GAMM|nr:hypothetical protein SVA_2031 [Sulfurifustis variabilis]
MKRLFVTVCLVLATLTAHAVTTSPPVPSYDIEVLVFEMRLPEYEGAELWTTDNLKPVDTADAVVAGETPVASELSNAATAIRSDPRFRVLLHKRWTQPAEARSASKPVLLSTGDRELDGTLRFYIARFLHLEMNLTFQPLALVQTAFPAESQAFQINEQRRIKTQELHYFDHPKFGAIVRVVPTGKG